MKQGRGMGSVSGSEEIAILNMVAWERPYKKSDIKGGENGGQRWLGRECLRLGKSGMFEG